MARSTLCHHDGDSHALVALTPGSSHIATESPPERVLPTKHADRSTSASQGAPSAQHNTGAQRCWLHPTHWGLLGDAPPAGLQPQRDAGLQPKEQEKPPKRPQAPFSPDTASSGKAEMLRGEKQSPQSSSFPQLSLSDMLSESMQNAVLRATPHTDEDYFPQGMTSCSIRGCIILQ